MRFSRAGRTSNVRRQSIARWRLLELLRERLLSDLLSRNGTSERLDELAGAERKILFAVEEL